MPGNAGYDMRNFGGVCLKQSLGLLQQIIQRVNCANRGALFSDQKVFDGDAGKQLGIRPLDHNIRGAAHLICPERLQPA